MRNWVPKVLEQRRQGLELYLQVTLHLSHLHSTFVNLNMCLWRRRATASSLPLVRHVQQRWRKTKHARCRRRGHEGHCSCVLPPPLLRCARCNLLLFCLFCQDYNYGKWGPAKDIPGFPEHPPFSLGAKNRKLWVSRISFLFFSFWNKSVASL